MAKALASRLKNVLHSIIFETQSAFLQERVIFDNVIVAYEAYQFMQRRKRGTLQEIHNLPTENSVVNIKNSVGN